MIQNGRLNIMSLEARPEHSMIGIGNDPAGITTQDPELMKRVDPIRAGERLANYLKVMTLEAQTIARASGKVI